MRRLALALGLLAGAAQAHAQFDRPVSVERTNQRIAGRVLDYSHNHGVDRRLYSPLFGAARDLYVYLPPGYTPLKAYPLVLYLHGGFGDEHAFIEKGRIEYLDALIQRGCFPPCVLVCPDITYKGGNSFLGVHSLAVDGCGGPVEAHILREVLPWVSSHFSIRTEREAHAILGVSAGGFGALSLAIRRRDLFASVATLAAPVNLRYATWTGNYFDDFDPRNYRPAQGYDRRLVVGRYYAGLVKMRAKTFIEPVFGSDACVFERIVRLNPADLLFRTGLQPGELAIYLGYGGRDNFNFDAQAESFAWLAARRGIDVTLAPDPGAQHTLTYFREGQKRVWHWLALRLLPPVDAGPPGPVAHRAEPLPRGNVQGQTSKDKPD